MQKRICLFAGYSAEERIEEYVVDYIKALSSHCQVYYLADCFLPETELEKLRPFCRGAWAKRHGKYDFGSYSELAKKYVGWETISACNELILANDSCYCLREFDHVFEKMDKKDCDAWSLLAQDEENLDCIFSLEDYLRIPIKKTPRFCLGSFFLALRSAVLKNRDFQAWLDGVEGGCRMDVCLRYECGLTFFLRAKGFRLAAYMETVYKNAVIYGTQAFWMLKYGFPVIKRRIFQDNPLSVPRREILIRNVAEYTGNSRLSHYLAVEKNGFFSQRKGAGFTWFREHRQYFPPVFFLDFKQILKGIAPPALYPYYDAARHCCNLFKTGQSLKGVFRNRPRAQSKSFHLPPASELKKVKEAQTLVIFFNVARDVIGGGMLSINRFVEKSVHLGKRFGFEVVVSGIPLQNPPVSYSMFDQALPMIALRDIVTQEPPRRAILFVPEHYVADFVENCSLQEEMWLAGIPHLQLNIMNQNNDYFPADVYIERCRELTDDLTITTAHEAYTTQEFAEMTSCPVTLLTPFLPSFHEVPFDGKTDIILYSNDKRVISETVTKNDVLKHLEKNLPEYELRCIESMTLDEYKEAISVARFTITFGEGYDGYYIEPFLSHSVAFAVFNKTFFPEEFIHADTVYRSWDELLSKIVMDVRRLESDKNAYETVSRAGRALVHKYTNDERAHKNLIAFYQRQFQFYPGSRTEHALDAM